MSRIDGLRAMAEQDVSPHERDIARAKLEAMGAWPPPPRPPAPPSAAAAPMPDFNWSVTNTAGTATSNTFGIHLNTAGAIYIRFTVQT